MLTRTLLLIAAVPLTLAAQPLVTIRPAPDQLPQGITIRTPSDPSFQSLVEKILPPVAVPLYQHILPYSILIRNETSTPIIALALTIQITDANGSTPKPRLYPPNDTLPGKENVLLAPGRDLLYTADPRFTYLAPRLSRSTADKRRPPLDELANRSLEPILSARAITLAFDSVLFADGTVKGPDEEHSFEAWTNELHEQAAFDNAVLAFQNRTTEELRQYLATVAASPKRTNQRIFAQAYELDLRNEGPEKLFKEVKEGLRQVTELSIHR